jgi:hypothetical protein
MKRNHRTLLQLVALGRLSPVEAERLTTAWSLQREDVWIFLVCLLLVVLPTQAPLHPLLGAIDAACMHLPGGLAPLGQLFSTLHHLTGGLL